MKPDPHTTPSAPRPPRPRGRVFDVVAPGKALAHPASRPVVIGHKASAQHAQMTVSGIGAPTVVRRDSQLTAHTKPEIAPQRPVAQAVEPVGATSDTPPTTLEVSSNEPVIDAQHLLEATNNDTPAVEPEKEDTLAAVAMEPDAPTLPAAEQPEPLPTPEHSVPEDIAPPSIDHQMVVSHHTTEPRSTGKLVGLILLALLFVLIIVDILMDVGIISTSIPHTHFF